MIEHPNIWFENFYKYIISPLKPSYGDLCVLSSNATTEAKESYNTMCIVGLVISCISLFINFWGLFKFFKILKF